MTKLISSTSKTFFKPRIYSRHPTHKPLRRLLPLFKFPVVIRLGSLTETSKGVTLKSGKIVKRVEINSIDSIKKASSKFLMKECFKNSGVKTAEYWHLDEVREKLEEWDIFPLVAKINYGSRGRGMLKIDDPKELADFLSKSPNQLQGYYLEKFYNYSKEFRLHVTKDGCFYTCRKALKKDTPEDKKYFRNDSNSIWYLEDSPEFNRPSNWDDIVKESVKALNSVGLDFGAVDLRVQSEEFNGEKRENIDFIVVEINSAPSFGDITLQKYLDILPKLINNKVNLHGI